jgi:porin
VRTLRAASFLLVACTAPAFADDTKPAPAPTTPAAPPAADAKKPAPAPAPKAAAAPAADASKTQPAPSAQSAPKTETTPSASQQAVDAIQEPIQPAGSSDDINEEIRKMRPRHAGILPNGPVSLFDPYFDKFNQRMDECYGVKFGLSYTWAYQRATDSDTAHKWGMAGDLDIFARAHFFGPETSPTRGVLGVNGEYRHDFNDQVPKELSDNYGGLWDSTNGFGRQDMELTQCWWEQHLAADRVVVTIGKIDPDNYYNKNRYQSDSTAFMSQAFSANPARKHPSNGLGINGLVKVAKDFYATAGVNDANGAKDKSGFHTIDEGDLFGAVEGGWTPTFEGRGKGAYRLTLWTIENATIAGSDDDHGVAVSCEQEITKQIVPFLRAAWSDGDATGVSRFVSGGVGLEGLVRKADLTGIGVGWGDPKVDTRKQTGFEAFHRFQLAPDVQLTLGYQYIIDPSFAPSSNHDPVGVFEIRVRIEF